MSFKVKDSHWETIISFLERNPSMATGRFNGPSGREANKKLWEDLSAQLNALGQGNRSVDKWHKTWTDFKCLLKRKATTLHFDQNETGGGPPTMAPLNCYEKRALQVLGESFFKGVGSTEIAKPKTPKKINDGKENQGTETTSSSSAGIGASPSTSEGQGTSSLASGRTDFSKRKSTTISRNVDHDYSFTPEPKKQKLNTEQVYEETIQLLIKIDDTIDKGLTQITNSIDKLTDAILRNVQAYNDYAESNLESQSSPSSSQQMLLAVLK